MLQRTQLMLDRQLKQDLMFLSQVKNQSMSELVRKFVSEKVEEEKKKVKRAKYSNPIQTLLKMAKRAEEIDKKYGYSGPTDGAINHDHYLYGAPKKQSK